MVGSNCRPRTTGSESLGAERLQRRIGFRAERAVRFSVRAVRFFGGAPIFFWFKGKPKEPPPFWGVFLSWVRVFFLLGVFLWRTLSQPQKGTLGWPLLGWFKGKAKGPHYFGGSPILTLTHPVVGTRIGPPLCCNMMKLPLFKLESGPGGGCLNKVCQTLLGTPKCLDMRSKKRSPIEIHAQGPRVVLAGSDEQVTNVWWDSTQAQVCPTRIPDEPLTQLLVVCWGCRGCRCCFSQAEDTFWDILVIESSTLCRAVTRAMRAATSKQVVHDTVR